MVNKNLSLLRENPANLDGEISILYELGLEEYEINYLVFLRIKELARQKWKD